MKIITFLPHTVFGVGFFFIVSIYRCQQLFAGFLYKILFSGLLTVIIIQMCVKGWHNMYSMSLTM